MTTKCTTAEVRRSCRRAAELALGPATMPFGRHKGRELAALPKDYLTWLAANVDLRPQLAQRVRLELQKRGQRRGRRRHHADAVVS